MATMMLFRRADSRTPQPSMAVSSSMMTRAGRLMKVVTPGRAPGAAVRATGRAMPKPDSSDWK
ncbi:hypothetical protein D3C72_1420890 [compost metagenome]